MITQNIKKMSSIGYKILVHRVTERFSMKKNLIFTNVFTFFRPNTNCVNTAGSFRCECKVGFEKLVPYEGCSDINECTGITIIKNLNQ